MAFVRTVLNMSLLFASLRSGVFGSNVVSCDDFLGYQNRSFFWDFAQTSFGTIQTFRPIVIEHVCTMNNKDCLLED